MSNWNEKQTEEIKKKVASDKTQKMIEELKKRAESECECFIASNDEFHELKTKVFGRLFDKEELPDDGEIGGALTPLDTMKLIYGLLAYAQESGKRGEMSTQLLHMFIEMTVGITSRKGEKPRRSH